MDQLDTKAFVSIMRFMRCRLKKILLVNKTSSDVCWGFVDRYDQPVTVKNGGILLEYLLRWLLIMESLTVGS